MISIVYSLTPTPSRPIHRVRCPSSEHPSNDDHEIHDSAHPIQKPPTTLISLPVLLHSIKVSVWHAGDSRFPGDLVMAIAERCRNHGSMEDATLSYLVTED
jgi:hypothetical protein